jgi:O-antigen ligase
MGKFKNIFDDWALFVLAFSCFGLLFVVRPATWMPTLVILVGGLLAAFNAEFRRRFFSLFRLGQLKWIALPFVAWLSVALMVSIAHSGASKFHVPSNELRFVLALSILCLTAREKTKHVFYCGLVVGACAAAAWGIYESHAFGFERALGTTNNPIHFGNLTALIALLSFSASLVDTTIGVKYRSVLLLSALVAVFASMMSLTRSSAILVLCMMPLVWLPQKDFFRKFAIKSAGVLLVAVICAIGFSAQVRERLRIHEFTAAFAQPEKIDYERLTSDRANMWHAAILIFKANPLVGVGPKGFSEAFEALAEEGVVQKTRFHNQPHNDILYSASMGGVFKLLAFFALIFGPFIFFYKSYQAKVDLVSKIPSIFGMQVIATFFLTGLTNSNFDLQIYSTMYAVLVCLLARLSMFEINAAELTTPLVQVNPSC